MEVTEQVRAAITKAGGVRALGRKWGVSATLISNAAKGRPTPAIFRKLGLLDPPRKPRAPRFTHIGARPENVEKVYSNAMRLMLENGRPDTVSRISRVCVLSYGATQAALEELERQGRVLVLKPYGKSRKFVPLEKE